jgi:DNA modification methylase
MLELNKIHLGDCYELIKQIPDKSVDCIYTDVPYLMQNGGKGAGAFGKRVHNLIRRDMANIIEGFNMALLDELFRISKRVNIFIWCNKQQLKPIITYFNDFSMEILTWNKLNPTPFTNNNWLPDIEYCLYFRGAGVLLNDGYEIKSKWFTSAINKNDKDLFEHPTIKPIELVKRHLLHATRPNDIVLDCFSGSGTTCVAAKELGRQFIGIEIDEKYHKISVDRLNGICANGQTSIFTDFLGGTTE